MLWSRFGPLGLRLHTYLHPFTHLCNDFFAVVTQLLHDPVPNCSLAPLLGMRHHRLLTALAALLDLASVTAQWGGAPSLPASSLPPPPPPAVSPNSVYDLRTCQNRQRESASPAEGYALQFGPQTIATTKSRFLDASNAEQHCQRALLAVSTRLAPASR